MATQLAVDATPAFGYANLAIRGRLFPNVVAEQVPAAMEMRPDLIASSPAATMRSTFSYAMLDRFDQVLGRFGSRHWRATEEG